jgi:hypothetical protein
MSLFETGITRIDENLQREISYECLFTAHFLEEGDNVGCFIKR